MENMTETQNTQSEADMYDEMYYGVSPEYTQTVARWGRNLTPERVTLILEAHAFSAEDLIEDIHDPILPEVSTDLPETLDAALLYAWLGY